MTFGGDLKSTGSEGSPKALPRGCETAQANTSKYIQFVDIQCLKKKYWNRFST